MTELDLRHRPLVCGLRVQIVHIYEDGNSRRRGNWNTDGVSHAHIGKQIKGADYELARCNRWFFTKGCLLILGCMKL